MRDKDVECITKELFSGLIQGSVGFSRVLRFTCFIKGRKPFQSLLPDVLHH